MKLDRETDKMKEIDQRQKYSKKNEETNFSNGKQTLPFFRLEGIKLQKIIVFNVFEIVLVPGKNMKLRRRLLTRCSTVASTI